MSSLLIPARGIQFAIRQRIILGRFNGVLTPVFCEAISKIFNFILQLKTINYIRSGKTAVLISVSITDSLRKQPSFFAPGRVTDRSNFMSDCKQMQARLKNGKYIDLKRKNNRQRCG